MCAAYKSKQSDNLDFKKLIKIAQKYCQDNKINDELASSINNININTFSQEITILKAKTDHDELKEILNNVQNFLFYYEIDCIKISDQKCSIADGHALVKYIEKFIQFDGKYKIDIFGDFMNIMELISHNYKIGIDDREKSTDKLIINLLQGNIHYTNFNNCVGYAILLIQHLYLNYKTERDYEKFILLLKQIVNNNQIPIETTFIEQSIQYLIMSIKDCHAPNYKTVDINKHVEQYLPQILDILEIQAKRKEIHATPPSKNSIHLYWELVEYADDIKRGFESFYDVDEFWEWLHLYPNITKFIKFLNKEKIKNIKNNFVYHLSIQYKFLRDGNDYRNNYLDDIENLCLQLFDICNKQDIKKYADKSFNDWSSTYSEIKFLVNCDCSKSFTDVRPEPFIGDTRSEADLEITFNGERWFVEIYTKKVFYSTIVKSQYRVNLKSEWDNLFNKKQLKLLRQIRANTIFVLNVDSQLAEPETKSQAFKSFITTKAPPNSEIVINGHGRVTSISIRNDKIIERTDLAQTLTTLKNNYDF